jgi:ribonuclease R
VRVQVSRVDLDGRKIDFRMVREGEVEKLLAKSDKPRAAIVAGGSATVELAQVRDADRLAKAATRAAKTRGAGVGTGDSSRRSRKPGPQRPAPKPRSRR